MALEKKSAPYAPPSNVIAVVRRFRERNLPERIDIHLLQDIGIPKGNVHRTIAALEFLELIEEDGTPTSTFRGIQIAPDEKYQEIFEGLVRTAYRDVFQIVDPSKDSQSIIDNHFRRYQPTSQRSRMVILFLGLCREAGISTLDTPRDRPLRKGGTAARPARMVANTIRPPSRATNVQSLEPAQSSPQVTPPSMAELRRVYIEALIEGVRQAAAQGKEVDIELLERIERLMASEESAGAEPKKSDDSVEA